MLPVNYQAAADLLAGRVILVTGAGQGIGRALAIACAKHGATVVLLGRSVKNWNRFTTRSSWLVIPSPLRCRWIWKNPPMRISAYGAGNYRPVGRLDGIVHAASAFLGLFPLEQESLDYWMTALRVNAAAPPR